MDGDASHPPLARPPIPFGASRPGGLRLAAWRGRGDIALVAGAPGGTPVPPDAIDLTVERAARLGIHRLLTGALSPREQEPFLRRGFEVHDRLHLLHHDLVDIPPGPDVAARVRRARRIDVGAALAVDGRAFEPFWRLDRAGLDDAIAATAAARFRVAVDDGVVGYAVTGRSGNRGYLQRLAVDPTVQGRGLGTALVVDGLRWLRRRKVDTALVNTQVANEGAFALYRRLGFVPEIDGLAVLTRLVP